MIDPARPHSAYGRWICKSNAARCFSKRDGNIGNSVPYSHRISYTNPHKFPFMFSCQTSGSDMLRRSTPTLCLPRVESSSKCVKQCDPIVGRLKLQTNPEISQIPVLVKLCPCRPRNKDPKYLTPMPHWKDWFGSLDLVAFNSTMQAHSTTVACTMTKICSLKADFNCASYLHICTSYNKLSRNSIKWILENFWIDMRKLASPNIL